jgi:hypothetical protein
MRSGVRLSRLVKIWLKILMFGGGGRADGTSAVSVGPSREQWRGGSRHGGPLGPHRSMTELGRSAPAVDNKSSPLSILFQACWYYGLQPCENKSKLILQKNGPVDLQVRSVHDTTSIFLSRQIIILLSAHSRAWEYANLSLPVNRPKVDFFVQNDSF